MITLTRGAAIALGLAVIAASALVALGKLGAGRPAPLSSISEDFFVMYSANAPRDAPGVFRRYFTARDLARLESLPPHFGVARARRYVLPTTLRPRWAGAPGLRHWIRQGCGRGTPGTIIYDPERRDLTPIEEQDNFVASVRRAAALVESTGCHSFGLAPGGDLLFGLDAESCTYELKDGFYRDISWKSVDIIDIQAQRLLGEGCAGADGVDKYASVVASIASYVRGRNPDISVVSQVSFRDSPPSRMHEGIRAVADVVDGIYFSYPSTHPETTCAYCSPSNLEMLLEGISEGRAGA